MSSFKLDFGSVDEERKYWTHEARSEKLPELFDSVEVVMAFRSKKIDLLEPNGQGMWYGYKLRDLYGTHREHVRARMLQLYRRLHASMA